MNYISYYVNTIFVQRTKLMRMRNLIYYFFSIFSELNVTKFYGVFIFKKFYRKISHEETNDLQFHVKYSYSIIVVILYVEIILS